MAKELRVIRELILEDKPNRSKFRDKNASKMVFNNSRLGESYNASKRITTKVKFLARIMPHIIQSVPSNQEWIGMIHNYFSSFTLKVPAKGMDIKLDIEYPNEESKKKCENAYSNIQKWLETHIEGDKEKDKAIYKEYYDKIFEHYTSTLIEVQDIAIYEPFQYLVYCYCLVHNQVANKEHMMDYSNNIKFILRDKDDLKKRELNRFKLVINAKQQFMKLMNDGDKVDSMLLAFELDIKQYPQFEDKQIALDGLAQARPEKFLEYSANKDLELIGFIEKAKLIGKLKSVPGSSMIFDEENKPIANNREEAMLWCKDVKNKSIVSEIEKQLKALNW